jgi:hypothetical protein
MSATRATRCRADISFAPISAARYAVDMSAVKIIAIIVLLSLGFHLLLFGYLKRRVAAAKRKQEIEP